MGNKEERKFSVSESSLGMEWMDKRILLNQNVCFGEELFVVNWLTFEYAFQCKSLLIVHLQNVFEFIF